MATKANKKTMATKTKQKKRNVPYIKLYRLNQIGGTLTIEQKNSIAKKLRCTLSYVEMALDPKTDALSYQIMLEAARVANAKNYLQKYTRLATVLFCMLLGAATANAQSVQIGNIKIEYNEAAAKNTGFALDVTNLSNGGSGSGLCKDASVAIVHVQKICGCVLTPNQVLSIFAVSKEDAPDWALKNAKVVKL